MTNTYQTEFTRENVTELAQHIQKGIKAFSEEKGKALDLFVIAAALQQSTYQILLRSLTENAQDGEKKIEAMKPISIDIIKFIDENRKENKTMPTEEMLATVFSSSLILEFYAHNRDLKLEALQGLNGSEVPAGDLEKEQDVAELIEQAEASSNSSDDTTSSSTSAE